MLLLGPIAFEATVPLKDLDPNVMGGDREDVSAMLEGIHSYYLTPSITLLALIAWIPQAWLIAAEISVGALSADSLKLQGIVFVFVGLSWMLRLSMDDELWQMDLGRAIYTWHNLVGWASMYNLLFAGGQWVLYAIVQHRGLQPNEA